MTIKEILEAHFKIEWNDWGQRQCQCGHEFAGKYSSKAHRAHVAEVLEAHTLLLKAREWSDGFHKGRKAPQDIKGWPRNPHWDAIHGKATNNGR